MKNGALEEAEADDDDDDEADESAVAAAPPPLRKLYGSTAEATHQLAALPTATQFGGCRAVVPTVMLNGDPCTCADVDAILTSKR